MLLIIDNYDSFTYNLYQGIATLTKDVRVIRNDKITVNDIITMKPRGVILSPGPGHPEEAGICIDLIRTFDKEKISSIPLLGVCLGHQAIGVAFGGCVIQSKEIVHGKQDTIFHQSEGLYQTLSSPFKAGRYHSLIIDRKALPASLVVDAENKEKVIMGVHHINLPIFGTQFHPESILTPDGPLILKQFIELSDQD